MPHCYPLAHNQKFRVTTPDSPSAPDGTESLKLVDIKLCRVQFTNRLMVCIRDENANATIPGHQEQIPQSHLISPTEEIFIIFYESVVLVPHRVRRIAKYHIAGHSLTDRILIVSMNYLSVA
ncbi:hypothetical protein RA210_U280030 [Rubrivivax sp. A210]|nr:hypothetical protein RA210_U280030 [Rubrivivax sp. A210]